MSKLKPIRDTINTINEKAMNYADEMYAQADAREVELESEGQEAPESQVEQAPRKREKKLAGSAGPGGSISLNRTSRPESWPSGTVRA